MVEAMVMELLSGRSVVNRLQMREGKGVSFCHVAAKLEWQGNSSIKESMTENHRQLMK